MNQPVGYQVANGVALLTLDRPEALNALSRELVEGLWRRLLEAGADPEVGAIILTGAGRAFCAGGDLEALAAEGQDALGVRFRELAGRFHLCIQELRSTGKPVIAALNGLAVGGGFSLALACDLRVMADDTYLRQIYTSAGLVLDGGGSWFLPRLVGIGRAAEIVLLDERLPAARCAELGLVNRVVPRDQVIAEARAMAEKLAGRARHALGAAKALLAASHDSDLGQQLERERLAIAAAADSPEGREGIAAFLGKRSADFAAARSKQ